MENRFTKLQGQYLAFVVAYMKLNRRAPAEADFQRYFEVTPPSVHNMILTLEGRGLIRRARQVGLIRSRSWSLPGRFPRWIDAPMHDTSEGHRRQLLDALCRFVADARQIAGVCRISLLGSIVTTKRNPKDIDVIVVVADDADLTPLATCARRLQGQAQSFNCGADVFLADQRGAYIGRTCHWRDCRPGVRRSCDALHCGRRPYLHDDLDTIRLTSAVVLTLTCPVFFGPPEA